MLTDIIARHRDQLDAEELAILDALAARLERLKAFAWPSTGPIAHSAFAKIERVYTQTPVDLFGQDSPSLAYNKLTVWRAKEMADGSLVAGDRLISLLISEQAMTRLMFSSNRGSNEIPATTAALDDLVLPPYKKSGNRSDGAFMAAKDKLHGRFEDIVNALVAAVEAGGAAKARETATQAADTLAGFVNKAGELDFYIERRQDTYSQKRVDLLSEAAHAALHAEKISSSLPLLEDHRVLNPETDRLKSPMLDALLDNWTEEESDAIAVLMALEAGHICAQYDLPDSLFIKDDTLQWPDNRAVPSYSPARKAVEDVRMLANSVLNPSVREGRNKLVAHQLGMSITQTHGWAGFLHSSLPATDDTYFTWRIAGAYMEDRFGTSEIRGQHHSVLEFCITSDDMMMLLRGHPTGKETPVTLRTVAGLYQSNPELHPNQQDGVRKIMKETMAADPRSQSLLESIATLKAHLAIKGGGKQWKEQADVLLNDVITACAAYDEALDDGFANGESLLRDKVGQMVREQLEDMRAALPDAMLHKLLS